MENLCKHINKDGLCLLHSEPLYKEPCHEGPCPDYERQTNADRIRSMTDEELAKWFALTNNGLKSCPKGARWPKSCECGCGSCWLDWLRQDAENYSEEDIADQEYQAAMTY